MPQTVFDVGDPITSRLKLGVVPDGTTVVTITVTRPDGTTITAPTISGFVNVDEKTAQFYATDDGSSTGTTLHAAGDWLAVWKVTGTGANIAPKVYNVAPLPGTGTRVPWSPFLSQVAYHVPWLTVDTTTPGSQVYLGTFTGTTTPTDEIAQGHIDSAVNIMSPVLGVPLAVGLQPSARAVAALRAAASLARAFPRNAADIATAAALDARADASWKLLLTEAEQDGTATTVLTPHWFMPDPVAWGDTNL